MLYSRSKVQLSKMRKEQCSRGAPGPSQHLGVKGALTPKAYRVWGVYGYISALSDMSLKPKPYNLKTLF